MELKLTPEELAQRHPSVRAIMRFFNSDHLPVELQLVAKRFENVAWLMVCEQDDSPELVAGLRKLLEAKDCFVRNALDQE